MNSTGSMRTLSVGLLSILLLASAASAAPSDADRCVAAKLNASGKRFASIAKCRAKAVLTGTPVDADCLAKAEQKFFDAFTKAEASGACAVTGDATTVDTYLGDCSTLIGDDVSRVCGDSVIAPSEECDDGNPSSADGCSASCSPETGYECAGEPSVCTPICGDGLIRGTEQCDDRNLDPDDGCSASCGSEPGWNCSGEPTGCTCGVAASISPPSSLRLPQTLRVDAGASFSGCALPLQYFWNCTPTTNNGCGASWPPPMRTATRLRPGSSSFTVRTASPSRSTSAWPARAPARRWSGSIR